MFDYIRNLFKPSIIVKEFKHTVEAYGFKYTVYGIIKRRGDHLYYKIIKPNRTISRSVNACIDDVISAVEQECKFYIERKGQTVYGTIYADSDTYAILSEVARIVDPWSHDKKVELLEQLKVHVEPDNDNE